MEGIDPDKDRRKQKPHPLGTHLDGVHDDPEARHCKLVGIPQVVIVQVSGGLGQEEIRGNAVFTQNLKASQPSVQQERQHPEPAGDKGI